LIVFLTHHRLAVIAIAAANGIMTLLPSSLYCWCWGYSLVGRLVFWPVKLLLFAALLLGAVVNLAVVISHTAG